MKKNIVVFLGAILIIFSQPPIVHASSRITTQAHVRVELPAGLVTPELYEDDSSHNIHYTSASQSIQVTVRNTKESERPPPRGSSYGSPEVIITLGQAIIDSATMPPAPNDDMQIMVEIHPFKLSSIDSIAKVLRKAASIYERSQTNTPGRAARRLFDDSGDKVNPELAGLVDLGMKCLMFDTRTETWQPNFIGSSSYNESTGAVTCGIFMGAWLEEDVIYSLFRSVMVFSEPKVLVSDEDSQNEIVPASGATTAAALSWEKLIIGMYAAAIFIFCACRGNGKVVGDKPFIRSAFSEC